MREKKRIIVIKIGSSVIFTKRNKLDEFRLAHIANQIICLQQDGVNVVLIVSGAVACGYSMTNTSDSLYLLSEYLIRQMAAGIGQPILMSTLSSIFAQKSRIIAQILLRKNDLSDGKIKSQFMKTLESYFKLQIIPVLNENDVVDLNSFGGNDFLAVEIAQMLNAQKVIILSTMDGSKFGIGGGKSKEETVKILKNANIDCLIVNGKAKDVLCYHVLKQGSMKFTL